MGNTSAILRANDSTPPVLADLQEDEIYLLRNDNAIYAKSNNEVVKLVGGIAGVSVRNINDVSATYTAQATDNVIICDGSFKVTLMTAVDNDGLELVIKNVGTGIITIDGDGSETIDGDLTFDIEQDDCLTLVSDGANWMITNFYDAV